MINFIARFIKRRKRRKILKDKLKTYEQQAKECFENKAPDLLNVYNFLDNDIDTYCLTCFVGSHCNGEKNICGRG